MIIETNMKEPNPRPDFSKAFPKRFITMSMADKYMAVCFIYDGVQYQNLCREENPDGTFNYSENCLKQLPYSLPFIGAGGPNVSQGDTGLIRYTAQEPAEFPDILSAISHYWIWLLLLCTFSALSSHIVYMYLRGDRYGLFSRIFGRQSNNERNLRFSAMPTVDEEGTISIGKIAFNPKSVLGHGSKGTCVFKGTFEKSIKCAVKRVVSQYLTIADREVDFLRSLEHPNLVRYLATEEDAQFVYISLELAEFTLSSLIEAKHIDTIGLSKGELCCQAALGLQYLHKLDIVHRDIKPQNILISFPMKPHNIRKVMISDFGLSKNLNNLDIGQTSTATRYFGGTQGWQAPEIIHAKLKGDTTLLPTKSADIFSLGCVFYYIISEGKHPFGDDKNREINIENGLSTLDSDHINGRTDLKVVEEQGIMAAKLIKAMLQQDAEFRPPIGAILKYPFFWSQADQLQFLQDVSDRIDKEDNHSEIINRVERDRRKIFAFGWKECLSKELQDDLATFRRYNERSVRHLLRAIRNKKHHYRELSEELKSSLGSVPDEFMVYFSSRFPELLPHIYQAMQLCKDENQFKAYYDQSKDEPFHFT